MKGGERGRDGERWGGRGRDGEGGGEGERGCTGDDRQGPSASAAVDWRRIWLRTVWWRSEGRGEGVRGGGRGREGERGE